PADVNPLNEAMLASDAESCLMNHRVETRHGLLPGGLAWPRLCGSIRNLAAGLHDLSAAFALGVRMVASRSLPAQRCRSAMRTQGSRPTSQALIWRPRYLE